MDFKLDVLFDAADLHTIFQAGENVVVAQPASWGEPSVAWLDFAPFEANAMEWDGTYGLYVSTTPVEQGATIELLSTVAPVAARSVYALEADQAFHGPLGQEAPSGSYGAENQVPSSKHPAMTFGLSQAVTVNGTELGFIPIDAVLVPSEQEVVFTPVTTLYVWLDDTIRGGTVLRDPSVLKHVQSRWTKVVFSGAAAEQTLRYDASQGKFVIVS